MIKGLIDKGLTRFALENFFDSLFLVTIHFQELIAQRFGRRHGPDNGQNGREFRNDAILEQRKIKFE
jgi:hypothetical protein